MSDDFMDEINRRMDSKEDMGLDISSLTLPELMMLSAQSGPILMMPSVTGSHLEPIGLGFIVAGIPKEVVFEMRDALDSILNKHGIIDRDPSKAIVSTETPFGGDGHA